MKRSIQSANSDSNKKMKFEEDIIPEVMKIPFKNLDEDFQKVLKKAWRSICGVHRI